MSQADKVSAYPVVNPRAPWHDHDRPLTDGERELEARKIRCRNAFAKLKSDLEAEFRARNAMDDHHYITEVLDDLAGDTFEAWEV